MSRTIRNINNWQETVTDSYTSKIYGNYSPFNPEHNCCDLKRHYFKQWRRFHGEGSYPSYNKIFHTERFYERKTYRRQETQKLIRYLKGASQELLLVKKTKYKY